MHLELGFALPHGLEGIVQGHRSCTCTGHVCRSCKNNYYVTIAGSERTQAIGLQSTTLLSSLELYRMYKFATPQVISLNASPVVSPIHLLTAVAEESSCKAYSVNRQVQERERTTGQRKTSQSSKCPTSQLNTQVCECAQEGIPLATTWWPVTHISPQVSCCPSSWGGKACEEPSGARSQCCVRKLELLLQRSLCLGAYRG